MTMKLCMRLLLHKQVQHRTRSCVQLIVCTKKKEQTLCGVDTHTHTHIGDQRRVHDKKAVLLNMNAHFTQGHGAS